ncbi:hypothetical protein Peur_025355 [Populus x canadensis]
METKIDNGEHCNWLLDCIAIVRSLHGTHIFRSKHPVLCPSMDSSNVERAQDRRRIQQGVASRFLYSIVSDNLSRLSVKTLVRFKIRDRKARLIRVQLVLLLRYLQHTQKTEQSARLGNRTFMEDFQHPVERFSPPAFANEFLHFELIRTSPSSFLE